MWNLKKKSAEHCFSELQLKKIVDKMQMVFCKDVEQTFEKYMVLFKSFSNMSILFI